MIKSDYLIIGSGPVGVFTLKYLLEKGHKVTILDNSKKINPQLKNKGLNLKDFDEKSEVYDLTNTAYFKNNVPVETPVIEETQMEEVLDANAEENTVAYQN